MLIFAISFLGSSMRAEDAPRRILIILHAYTYTLPATTIMADAARAHIVERAAQKIEFHGDFLDLFNVPDPGYAQEVQVRDNGTGICPAEQDGPFKPFFTTKGSGLGLGLTICSTIVQAHGGTPTLLNQDGASAVAGVTLPAPKLAVAAK